MESAFADATLADDVTQPRRGTGDGGAPRTIAALRERAMASRVLRGPRLTLPAGIVVDVPARGRVLTVPMDCGFDVHIERYDADDALVTIEAPAGISFGAANVDEHRARRRFARLLSPFRAHPALPVRWLTLSFQDAVRLAGVGRIVVEDEPATFVIGARRVGVRRLRARDAAGPQGAVELLIDAGSMDW